MSDPAVPAQETPASGSSEPLQVSKGFGSVVASGIAEGAVGEQRCAGFFPSGPQHTMVLADAMTAFEIAWDAEGVVLEVHSGPNHWCSRPNELHLGRGAWSAGEYSLRFGVTTSGAEIPYDVTLREK